MPNSIYPGSAVDPIDIAEIAYGDAISYGLTLTNTYPPMIVTP
jgi:hypothetical protein